MTATCKTCRWWGKDSTSRKNTDDIGLPVGTDFRPCDCPHSRDGRNPDAALMIGFPIGMGRGVPDNFIRSFTVIMGPEYGCVHHEETRDG